MIELLITLIIIGIVGSLIYYGVAALPLLPPIKAWVMGLLLIIFAVLILEYFFGGSPTFGYHHALIR